MTAAKSVFVDTNVLIYANAEQMPLHPLAVQRLGQLESAEAELWLSRQILREYLAGLTRPGAFDPPIDHATILEDVRDLSRRLRMAEDGARVTERLLALVGQFKVAGKKVHDANIVATMQAYGIRELLTHNTADFARYSGLITILPLAP